MLFEALFSFLLTMLQPLTVERKGFMLKDITFSLPDGYILGIVVYNSYILNIYSICTFVKRKTKAACLGNYG